MDNPFSIELPRLREIAEQRGDGVSWQKIAEAYPAEEPALQRAAENAPEWERVLSDARLKSLACAATEAVQVLRQELHSENPRIRMQAATQLLRLHMATMKQAPKAKASDELESDRNVAFERERVEPADAGCSEANGLQVRPGDDEPAGKHSPASQPANMWPDIREPKRAEPANRKSPDNHSRQKVNLQRNMLLAPLLSPKRAGCAKSR